MAASRAPARKGTAPRKTADTIMAATNRAHGAETLVRGDQIRKETIRVTSGLLELDIKLGGGWPVNHWVEVIGNESCLDGETRLNYHAHRPDGTVSNAKGGTIANLWRRLHGDRHFNAADDDVYYTLPSVDAEDRIIHNRVVDVVRTGVQECFEVVTESGERIVATGNHRFYNGETFERLKDMTPGDQVMIHNNTCYTVDTPPTISYMELHVKQHGVAGVHRIYDRKTGNTYVYHRVRRSRAVVEAQLNNMSFEEYINTLNNGDISNLVFLPRDMHVHHIDEDKRNDALTNLAVITPEDHGREHAHERHGNLRFIAVVDRIATITPAGERETYDVKMTAPYHNYVADHFVTHNSGKTAMILTTVAANMALDPEWTCLWIASEHFMPEWAEEFGIDLARMYILAGNVMEVAYNTVLDMLDNRSVDCIVIDSYPALVAAAEDDSLMEEFTVGIGARLTGKFFRKSEKAAKRSIVEREDGEIDRPCIGFFVNQWREKIGVMHGDPRTTPGGRGKNYHFFIRIETKRDEWLFGDKKTDKIGQRMKFLTVKNKTYKPQQVATADFYFESSPADGVAKAQFDTIRMVCNLAVEIDVIEQRGAWYYFAGAQLANGFDNMVRHLRYDDFDTYVDIHHAVFTHYLPHMPPPGVVRPMAIEEPVEEEEPEPAWAPVARRVVRKKT